MNRLLGTLHQQRRLERHHGDRKLLPTDCAVILMISTYVFIPHDQQLLPKDTTTTHRYIVTTLPGATRRFHIDCKKSVLVQCSQMEDGTHHHCVSPAH
jgi:hypothetical protein